MIEEEDYEESERGSQKKDELVISEESLNKGKTQTSPPIFKDLDVQAIDAFIKEESKKFEEAENIIAEVIPEVKQSTRQGKICDSRLIYAENDWSENKIKVPCLP